MILTTTFLIGLDQLVKFFLINFTRVRLVFNQGSAFSLGSRLTGFSWLIWLSGLGLTVYYFVIRSKLTQPRLGALSLMVAGAWGNLIDRLFYPGPVDYLDISRWLAFPVFNLADIYLVLGVSLLIYTYAQD
jgi:signal peptidase II